MICYHRCCRFKFSFFITTITIVALYFAITNLNNRIPVNLSREVDQYGRRIPLNLSREEDQYGRRIPLNLSREEDQYGRRIPLNLSREEDHYGRRIPVNLFREKDLDFHIESEKSLLTFDNARVTSERLSTTAVYSTNKWEDCLHAIQTVIVQRLVDKLENIFLLQNPILLVDPAYHFNVGDNLISYGELVLMEMFTLTHTECGLWQSLGRNKPCKKFGDISNNSLVLFHGGGNWGDLYTDNYWRINSFLPMLQKNMTIIAMPSSLFYRDQKRQQKQADELRQMVQNTIGFEKSKRQIIFTWRQENSYKTAVDLYPFVDNRLVPDIAFMIGPIRKTSYYSKTANTVDLLFLLRNDIESMVKAERNQEMIEKTLTEIRIENFATVTFNIVDWPDRLQFYKENTSSIKPMQQVRNQGVFDYNKRIESVIALFAAGKVIITDRLHASIFAFLSYKPHVFIDQMYQKIHQTRSVAFNSSKSCQDENELMYKQAFSIKDAIEKAVHILKH